MRTNGPLETGAMASADPVSAEIHRKVERVAQHLVGSLPGGGEGRVGRLAAKLAEWRLTMTRFSPDEQPTRKLERPSDDTDGKLTGKPDARHQAERSKKEMP